MKNKINEDALQMRNWLRAAPTAAEREHYQQITGSHYGDDVSRAEILLSRLAILAESETWAADLLPAFSTATFRLLQSSEEPPEEALTPSELKAAVDLYRNHKQQCRQIVDNLETPDDVINLLLDIVETLLQDYDDMIKVNRALLQLYAHSVHGSTEEPTQ